MSPQPTGRSVPPPGDERGADRFLSAVAVDGEVLFAGPATGDVLGLDRRALVGDDFLEYVHPKDRDAVSDALSAVARERRITHRLRTDSGGYVWVESVVDEDLAPQFGGRVVTTRVVDSDRTFPEHFRQFLEYGTDIVTVVDADGRVRYESPSVAEVLGYEQGSLVGQSPLGFVHPDDRERVTEQFYRALAADEPSGSLEFRYRTADGDWVWLESRARGLPDDAVVGRLVINSRDVSERKRRERRLADRNERLDRFASIVSHDLRNPLSVVRGSIEMARLREDVDALERGERGVERIDRLVTELLTLARQGRTIDTLEEFTLAGVAHEAFGTAGTASAELVIEEDARLRADRSRLLQAFENLIRNSMEHASEDATVTVGPTTGGFYLADDGPGIPADERESVFEPGYTTTAEGTGYGLDIVREVVTAHDWEVVLPEPESPAADRAPGAVFEIRAPTPATADDGEPWIAP